MQEQIVLIEDWKSDPIGAAERGENPMVLARMRSGFAVMGDTQFLPGYCLLMASPPVVHLTDLSLEQRDIYLQDMGVLGEAIMQVCQPRLVNYEILGNSMPLLHAHLFPRYEWEDERLRYAPVWDYAQEYWDEREYEYVPEIHGELKQRLSETLLALMEERGITPPKPQGNDAVEDVETVKTKPAEELA